MNVVCNTAAFVGEEAGTFFDCIIIVVHFKVLLSDSKSNYFAAKLVRRACIVGTYNEYDTATGIGPRSQQPISTLSDVSILSTYRNTRRYPVELGTRFTVSLAAPNKSTLPSKNYYKQKEKALCSVDCSRTVTAHILFQYGGRDCRFRRSV